MPQVGEKRSDGKVWAGADYEWQSPETVWRKSGQGTEVGQTKTLPGLGTKVWTGKDYGWQTQATIDARKKGATPPPPKPPSEPASTPPATPSETPSGQPPSGPKPSPAAPATPSETPSKPSTTPSGQPPKKDEPAAPKPSSTPAAPEGDAMAKWRAANPKLAAAAAERERIRGTAQTDNPLIDKEMRARMPQNTPSIQDPELKTKLGNLAPSYSRLLDNPNALKGAAPAAPKPTPSPQTTTTAFAKTTPELAKPSPAVQSAGQQYGSRALSSTPAAFKPATTSAGANPNAPTNVVQTNRIASARTQPTVAPIAGRDELRSAAASRPQAPAKPSTMKTPTRAPIRQMENYSQQPDAYDIVLEYLLSQGHAETIEEAHYIMLEMDSSDIQNVIKEGVPIVPLLGGAAALAGLYGMLKPKKPQQPQQTAKPPARPGTIDANVRTKSKLYRDIEAMQ